LKRTLRYADTVLLTSTSGGTAFYQFRANSCFDPDLTGTGHQPRYYDQLCTSVGPYQTYRVLSSTVRLCIPPSSSHQWNIAAGFSDNSSLSGVISGAGAALSFAEYPGAIGWVLPNASGPSHTMSLTATMAQIHNVPEQSVRIEDSYAAAYNANPVDTAYFNIIGNCISATTDSIFVGVFLEQEVMFEDPYLVGSS
jgi:hypothetical protein